MDQTAPSRTRLEVLLYENGISEETAAKAIGISKKSMNNKVKRRTQFNIKEMRGLQIKLFPEMSLEEIFEGYGE